MKEHTNSKLRDQLYYNPRTQTIPKTTLKNPILDDIIEQEDHVMHNRELMKQMHELKKMDLLKRHEIVINAPEKIVKKEHEFW